MNTKKMQGYETPSDKMVPVQVGQWDAMKLALWRSKVAWEVALKQVFQIVAACKHDDGCEGAKDEYRPCLDTCPDREQRMSALVILNAARVFAPLDGRRPADGPYYAPSREKYSETLAELAAAQAELEVLRGTVVTMPSEKAPPNEFRAPTVAVEAVKKFVEQEAASDAVVEEASAGDGAKEETA